MTSDYRIALRNAGRINPAKIEDYIAADGYQALEKEIHQRGVLLECMRYIVCNADEGGPRTAFAEKNGTFVNSDRRVGRVRRAVDPPGKARQDWKVLREIAAKRGHPMTSYRDESEVIAFTNFPALFFAPFALFCGCIKFSV